MKESIEEYLDGYNNVVTPTTPLVVLLAWPVRSCSTQRSTATS